MQRVGHYASALFLTIAVSISAAAAHAQTADAQKGARQFALCAACHTRTAAEPAKSGPSIIGVYGKKAATVDPNFAYSTALKGSDLTWSDDALDKWLSGPSTVVPGTNMAFAGVADPAVRANIIAYIKQLGAGG